MAEGLKIENLKPYAAYKPSGLGWLGDIPEHWESAPGFAAFRERKVKNTGMKEKTVLSLSYGKIVVKPAEKLHGLVPDSFETYQVVNPGDIIIRSTDLQNDWNSKRVGLVQNRGIITSAYLCFRTTEKLRPSYGYQLLNALDLMKVFYGMGSGLRQNLDFSDFKRMPVFLPPPAEQDAIVSFLGWATSRLDRAIKAKRRVIMLLNEQKQAIINRAVTHGLDPSVPFKPSGIGWLGDIPAHWGIRALKRVLATKITDGPHETPELLDEGVDFMSAESLVGGKFVFEKRRGFISRELHEQYCAKCRPQRHDVFMCKSGATTGKVAIVETEREFSVWSPLALLRANKAVILPHFLFASLQTHYVKQQVQERWSFGTQPNLSMGAMGRIAITVPSLSEQEDALRRIEEESCPLISAISRLEREIDLIREYRTRLISDVVTGKLDVREAALNLPDERDVAAARDLDAVLDEGETEDEEVEA